MNYKLNDVAESTDGYGFTILDSRGKLLVYFEFENEDRAREAHRIIDQTVAIATKIVPRV